MTVVRSERTFAAQPYSAPKKGEAGVLASCRRQPNVYLNSRRGPLPLDRKQFMARAILHLPRSRSTYSHIHSVTESNLQTLQHVSTHERFQPQTGFTVQAGHDRRRRRMGNDRADSTLFSRETGVGRRRRRFSERSIGMAGSVHPSSILAKSDYLCRSANQL